jgi:hypothetical protein
MRSWSQDPQGYIEDRSIPVPFSGCWLWTQCVDAVGYGIGAKNRNKTSAHRLSYEAFNGPIPSGLCVRHSCDVKTCVNPAHLSVGTTQDNTDDKVSRGRHARGMGVGTSKLTDTEVLEIYEALGSHTAVGARYGVTRQAVAYIRSGKSWAHLTGHPNGS